ncbi:hypothetical protein DFJ73DRAFT_856836 [Zopfochytrium polystomum]|nr:hypothetical protein DFJ73DRAFT_856836 [Zopfochytrium polystomum]
MSVLALPSMPQPQPSPPPPPSIQQPSLVPSDSSGASGASGKQGANDVASLPAKRQRRCHNGAFPNPYSSAPYWASPTLLEDFDAVAAEFAWNLDGLLGSVCSPLPSVEAVATTQTSEPMALSEISPRPAVASVRPIPHRRSKTSPRFIAVSYGFPGVLDAADAVDLIPKWPRNVPPKILPPRCNRCKSVHVTCDAGRPCQRCIRIGKADTCTDAVRKKRGRPKQVPAETANALASVSPPPSGPAVFELSTVGNETMALDAQRLSCRASLNTELLELLDPGTNKRDASLGLGIYFSSHAPHQVQTNGSRDHSINPWQQPANNTPWVDISVTSFRDCHATAVAPDESQFCLNPPFAHSHALGETAKSILFCAAMDDFGQPEDHNSDCPTLYASPVTPQIVELATIISETIITEAPCDKQTVISDIIENSVGSERLAIDIIALTGPTMAATASSNFFDNARGDINSVVPSQSLNMEPSSAGGSYVISSHDVSNWSESPPMPSDAHAVDFLKEIFSGSQQLSSYLPRAENRALSHSSTSATMIDLLCLEAEADCTSVSHSEISAEMWPFLMSNDCVQQEDIIPTDPSISLSVSCADWAARRSEL